MKRTLRHIVFGMMGGGGAYQSLAWLETTSRQTLVSGSAGTDWAGRNVTAHIGSTVIWAYRQAGTHLYDAASVIHIHFSTDNGATWSAVDTFTNGNAVTGAPFNGHSTNDTAEPLLIVCPNGDILLHVGEKNSSQDSVGTWQYRSTNGGAAWSDEGQINSDADFTGGQDHVVIGSDIYITTVSDAWASPTAAKLYKSSDNGTTWTVVSTIASTSDNASETGIAYLGSNTFVCILRDTLNAKTYKRVSTDLGQTWGTLTDVTAALGVLQRARLRIYADEPSRIYMWGRDYHSTGHRTAIYFSDDAAATWSAPFFANENSYSDCGYADMIRLPDHSFRMLNYEGAQAAANIVEYLIRPVALPWTPAQATTVGGVLPAMWHKASSLNLAGTDAVASWTDSSGNSRTASQGTGAAQPTYQIEAIGGKPALRFDGSDDRLAIANATTMLRNVSGVTVIVVHKPSSVSGARVLFWSPNAVPTTRALVGINVGGGSGYGGGGRRLDADSFQQVAGGTPDTSAVIQTVVFDYANSNLFVYINGVLVASKTDFQTDGNTSNTSAAASAEIGRDGSSNLYVGDAAEEVTIASALVTADRQQYEAYLSRTYGIAVS